MAAVDVDVHGAKKAAKLRVAAPGGSRWKRGGEGGDVHPHEQVVCSIKAHQNGTLEIAPGGYDSEVTHCCVCWQSNIPTAELFAL